MAGYCINHPIEAGTYQDDKGNDICLLCYLRYIKAKHKRQREEQQIKRSLEMGESITFKDLDQSGSM